MGPQYGRMSSYVKAFDSVLQLAENDHCRWNSVLSGSIDLNAKDFTEVLPSKKYEINIWNFTKEGTKDRVVL